MQVGNLGSQSIRSAKSMKTNDQGKEMMVALMMDNGGYDEHNSDL